MYSVGSGTFGGWYQQAATVSCPEFGSGDHPIMELFAVWCKNVSRNPEIRTAFMAAAPQCAVQGSFWDTQIAASPLHCLVGRLWWSHAHV
jgi:hypothetical protein